MFWGSFVAVGFVLCRRMVCFVDLRCFRNFRDFLVVHLVFESSWIIFSLNLPNGIYSTNPLAFSRICCQPWLFQITVAFFPYTVVLFSRYFWYRIKAWKHMHNVGTFQKDVWVCKEKWDERQRHIRAQTCWAFRIKCRSSVSCCGM